MRESGFTERYGYLVLRRINYFEEPSPAQQARISATGLSHKEILVRYKGIEGEPWPETPCLQDIRISDSKGIVLEDQMIELAQYYHQALKIYGRVDMICLANPYCADESLLEHAEFVGYDWGCFESQYNYFSSVFNEIVYGLYPQLTEFADTLNDNLLFPTLDAAEAFSQKRLSLLDGSHDLETFEAGEPCGTISVYVPSIVRKLNKQVT